MRYVFPSAVDGRVGTEFSSTGKLRRITRGNDCACTDHLHQLHRRKRDRASDTEDQRRLPRLYLRLSKEHTPGRWIGDPEGGRFDKIKPLWHRKDVLDRQTDDFSIRGVWSRVE